MGETKYAESYDGLVTVHPPTRRHVVINRRLTLLLSAAVPPDLEVLPQAGWQATPESLFIPDLMVVRLDTPGDDVIRAAPLLVVEITSPSTRSEDLGRNMKAYAEGGADWYWIVDPELTKLATYQRSGGRYTLRALSTGGEVADIAQPIAIAVNLTELFE